MARRFRDIYISLCIKENPSMSSLILLQSYNMFNWKSRCDRTKILCKAMLLEETKKPKRIPAMKSKLPVLFGIHGIMYCIPSLYTPLSWPCWENGWRPDPKGSPLERISSRKRPTGRHQLRFKDVRKRFYTVYFFFKTLKEISCLNFKTIRHSQKVTPAHFYYSAYMNVP